jgi:GH25 family lysozyme M1 (1,4-beta-N-acetylmuramidase)
MNTLRAYGYTSGYYTFYDWAVNRLNAQQLMNEGYSFWLARWPSDALASNPYYFGGWTNGHPNIWQFRSDGYVPGISGNVDMNYLYMV